MSRPTRGGGWPRALLSAIALACSLAAAPSWAGAIDQLHRFLAEVHSGRGEFAQTVSGRSGRKPQQSSGEFAFQRPGKFSWHYQRPFPQQLVGDGERMWSYDPELNQVTVKKIGEALGSTPAAILAGKGEIERNFALSEGGTADGLDWVDARPLANDSPFTAMRLGFAGAELRAMEIRDGFGQLTLLKFLRFERNPALDPAQFRFRPPTGADVVGE